MTYIRLKNADLDFQIHNAGTHRLLHPETISTFLGGKMRLTPTKRIILSALRGITLDIEDGQRLGLIGHNGSGKSTLLRLLAGIYHPTRGTVERRGRISPVFNISLGMSEDFTGYENIKLGCLLFGMTPEEIEAAVSDIEDFTELGDYLNLPFRTYSDGMKTRLSFAIATAKMPEVLLLDEGIGAGDAVFQEKAQRRMRRFVDRSQILVLASHSRELVKQMCTSAVLLEQGQMVFRGGVDEAFDVYAERLHRGTG